MSQKIKQEVDRVNAAISYSLAKNHFVHNNEIVLLLEELGELQDSCEHSFNGGGYCEFCGVIKEED